MTLTTYLADPGNAIFYDPEFRNVLYAHRTYLKTAGTVMQQIVSPHLVKKYGWDLTGLFNELGIPLWAHYPTMLINDLISYDPLVSELTVVLIPDRGILQDIADVHLAVATS